MRLFTVRWITNYSTGPILFYLTYKELRHLDKIPTDLRYILSRFYLTYKELRQSRVHLSRNLFQKVFYWLYLTYKELRHKISKFSVCFIKYVLLYLTYKELLVCLCLSPRAPKKRANSCLLGSMRICSPFVL